MNKKVVTVNITINRHFLMCMILVLALFAGLIASVNDADASPKKLSTLCATQKGSVVKRSTCRRTETQIAAGSYTTTGLPLTPLVAGMNTMNASAGSYAVSGASTDSKVVVGRTLTAQSLLSTTLQTVTTRYAVPANWSGKISGTCPDTAPIPVTWGAYSPEWEPLILEKKVNFKMAPLWFPLGTPRASMGVNYEGEPSISDSMSNNNVAVTGRSVLDPYTLYVTQVCAPIVSLESK